ncbi:hypothetical protein HZC21_03495 [Candidatus Peregrinibacteria bacterium]|nr:hypothetical protein [Candidatus Peregrinibacteria bacterium]
MHINKNRAGLILGTFLGLFHLLWSILVAVGVAQWWMDFVLKLHFLNNPFAIAQFDWIFALGLVVMTFVVGYVLGWILAWLWNSMHK